MPRDPKGPNYLHTNQDSMMPPGGPPEGPPEGEESRLGDPFEFPFDVPNSILGPTSVLVVAERLGGTPSPWAAEQPTPRGRIVTRPGEGLVRARFLVLPGCCCSWPRVVDGAALTSKPLKTNLSPPVGLAKPAFAGMIVFPQFRLQTPLGL